MVQFASDLVDSMRAITVDPGTPYLYLGVKSANSSAANRLYLVLILLVNTPRGWVKRQIATSVLETAANTFTQTTITLTSYFTMEELKAGVIPLSARLTSSINVPSAANTLASIRGQLTKTSKTDILDIVDSDVLKFFTRYYSAGANANDINFDEIEVYP